MNDPTGTTLTPYRSGILLKGCTLSYTTLSPLNCTLSLHPINKTNYSHTCLYMSILLCTAGTLMVQMCIEYIPVYVSMYVVFHLLVVQLEGF